MATVLIIDNNTKHAETIARELDHCGIVSGRELNGLRGIESAVSNPPDLVLVEIALPDISGIEVLRRLKRSARTSEIPVVCISEVNTEMEKIVAFELGATDYLVKPVSPRELVLRMRAILRRTTAQDDRSALNIGPIRINVNLFNTTVHGIDVSLTRREFCILSTLAQAKGRVLSREELLDTAWGKNTDVLERTVDAHVRALRAKLGTAAACLETVNRVGYCLRARPDPVLLQNGSVRHEKQSKPVSVCRKTILKTQQSSGLKDNRTKEKEQCLRKVYG